MPDFMASILIFGIVIGMFMTSWNHVVSDQSYLGTESVMMEAENTATFLVNTPGYPENWDSETVDIVGFAEEENILDYEKIGEFGELDYTTQKDLMSTRGFYLKFENESGTMDLNGKTLFYGREFENPEFVYPISRTVKINDSGEFYEAEMNYVVYQ